MVEDIEDYLDLLDGDLRWDAQRLVDSLQNDRQQAQKARLEARMATTQINQQIHEIAVNRWRMLPIAVQREHDILAMDIAELQWHLKMEKNELRRAQNKLDYAKTINDRVKADIEFNQEHTPLVEEKLRIEQAAIVDIKNVQADQDNNLRTTKEKLRTAEFEFHLKSKTLRDERTKYINKLESVKVQLEVLKADLLKKEKQRRNFIERIANSKSRIVTQEVEIEKLEKEAEILRAKERIEQARIDVSRGTIRKLDQETNDLDQERIAIEDAMNKRKEDNEKEVNRLDSKHEFLITEIDRLTKERDLVRMNNEGARMKLKTFEKQRVKMEKDLERIRKNTAEADKEYKSLCSKTKALTATNNELGTQIERKERQSTAVEDNLVSMIEQTRTQIEESNRVKKDHDGKIRNDSEEYQRQTEILNETKAEAEAYQKKLQDDIDFKNNELDRIEAERIHNTKLTEETEVEIVNKGEEFKAALATLSNDLEKIKAEFNQEANTSNNLRNKLAYLETHEQELIQRTKELKAEQIGLKEKREVVMKHLEVLRGEYAIVEGHYQMQKESLDTMEERLKEAKDHRDRREFEFTTLLVNRENEKKHLTECLRELVMNNAELAQSYKVLQAREMAVKEAMSGFYELRTLLEDTKVMLKKLIHMEEEFHNRTAQAHGIRDRVHIQEYGIITESANLHVARVLKIEEQLHIGLDQVQFFLKKLSENKHIPVTEVVKRDSLMGYQPPAFGRKSTHNSQNPKLDRGEDNGPP